jgi:hypothetical protein
VVLGRYAMGPAVGRGATAVVHRARDLRTGDDVAVKAVPVELGIADRVDVEARAASRLSHPGIVALRDAGRDAECLYLVCDLVEGRSLSEVLRSDAPPSDRAAVRLIGEVLDALAHAHARGVVHRDVKPANILIGPDGHARLSDFGVARIVDETSLTLTGSVVGTVAYMAPEQALGQPVGSAADVYAACLVLHECLTGSNPILAPAPAETARRAAAAAVPSLEAQRPDLPAALTGAVDAGLRRRADLRPSAHELAGIFADVAEAGGVRRRALGRWERRLPVAACAAAGAALGAFAVMRGAPPEWSTAAFVAAGAVAGGLLAAWSPRAAALAAVAGGALMAGAAAPGMALILGALGALLLLTGWSHGRLLLLPALAPVLFALGLGPLYAVAAGLAPRWPARLWAAVAGMCATIAWQVAAGADGLMAGGGYLAPAVTDLEDEGSPVAAARRLWEPLGAEPVVLAQIGVMVVAALTVPLVMRARPGIARAAAAALWVAGMLVALSATATEIPAALGAAIPAAIVVCVWAVWPWRLVPDRGLVKVSATLRG